MSITGSGIGIGEVEECGGVRSDSFHIVISKTCIYISLLQVNEYVPISCPMMVNNPDDLSIPSSSSSTPSSHFPAFDSPSRHRQPASYHANPERVSVPAEDASNDGVPNSASIDERQRIYSNNRRSTESFLQLMWLALKDKVLIMLSIAAVISLALGLFQDFGTPKKPSDALHWVEGAAIVVAILIVVSYLFPLVMFLYLITL